jgi:hypothetical protein
MPPKATLKKWYAVNRLLNGWGIVEGRLVYVPLWDPPYELLPFKHLIAAAALADATRLVTSKAMSGKLHEAAGALLDRASNGFTKSWQDGDPLCPPWPFPFPRRRWVPIPFPWPPPPGPDPGPDPGPEPYPIHEFIEQLSPVARNTVAGDLVSKIGTMIGDKAVVELGREIMAGR